MSVICSRASTVALWTGWISYWSCLILEILNQYTGWGLATEWAPGFSPEALVSTPWTLLEDDYTRSQSIQDWLKVIWTNVCGFPGTRLRCGLSKREKHQPKDYPKAGSVWLAPPNQWGTILAMVSVVKTPPDTFDWVSMECYMHLGNPCTSETSIWEHKQHSVVV